ncbi:MAG: ABC transporter substrate-binding protein [Labilithrix sp.]|nr:ABC transporter substrate-binding protein [Labilithrix sp.]
MTRVLGRRALLGGLAGVIAAGAAVARRSARGERVLRVGVMSNLTHAPMIAGLGSGRIAEALRPVAVETRVFRSGPRVAEALLGGAIEAGTAGPAGVVVHHARHAHGAAGGLRILGGCCSGGASLVVTRASGIARADDLRGKRLAVTQIGTTQDVALRIFLRSAGLRDATRGGDVTVLAVSGATILEQMKRGDLHGAWLPEPWATRIVHELASTRLIDERDLWPDRRFATAVLASRADNAADPLVGRLTRALDVEIARAVADPRATLREAHDELKRHVGNPGAFDVFEDAARFVDFTSDPIRASVERFGDDAAALGFCPPRPTAGLFV